jgi:hypothetical protein
MRAAGALAVYLTMRLFYTITNLHALDLDSR